MPTKKTISTEKASPKKQSLTADVYSVAGAKLREEVLPADIFGLKPNPALVSQYVRVYLINQRQGTVSTKTRGEVAGTTKKMYRQKGTGRARHSTAKANLFTGGGVTFGPRPRTFQSSINQKQRRQALFCTLSTLGAEKKISILDTSDLPKKPKTKQISDFLNKSGIKTAKTMFVCSELKKDALVLSARNIPSVEFSQATNLNAYEVMHQEHVVFVGDSLKTFSQHFSKKA